MYSEFLKDVTVEEMIKCDATSFAFWAIEFAIMDSDIKVNVVGSDATFEYDRFHCVTVSLSDTLETLEAKFSKRA